MIHTTIPRLAREIGVPAGILRRLVSEGRIAGFYTGTATKRGRFLVNADAAKAALAPLLNADAAKAALVPLLNADAAKAALVPLLGASRP
jgi:hypothetical protein